MAGGAEGTVSGLHCVSGRERKGLWEGGRGQAGVARARGPPGIRVGGAGTWAPTESSPGCPHSSGEGTHWAGPTETGGFELGQKKIPAWTSDAPSPPSWADLAQGGNGKTGS